MRKSTTKLRYPLLSIFLLVWVFGLLIEPGDLGSSDVAYRLQASHAIWTGEPQVSRDISNTSFPIGRSGLRQIPWGIGQSLVMLPADIFVSSLASTFHLPKEIEIKVRQIGVGYLTFPVISAVAISISVLLLRRIGLDYNESLIGGISSFFCTSLFPYTQIHQENSCLLLFDLVLLYGVMCWIDTQRTRYLLLIGIALSMSILTRLPSVLDLFFLALFGLLVSRERGLRFSYMMRDVLPYVIPFLIFALVGDRIYQFDRFGTWTDTYVDRYAHQVISLQPWLPSNWPWTYRFGQGVYLILASPERSIFLFDPLLLVTLWISLRFWSGMAPAVRFLVVTAVLLLVTTIAFYARHDVPVGAATWGSRFTTSPVILLSMLAVPLLLSFKLHLTRTERVLGVSMVAISAFVQFLSVIFWYQLEEGQMHDLGSGFMIGMRFVNVVALGLGKFHEWHLITPSVAPRYLVPNFLPFLASKYISARSAHVLQLIWCTTVVLALGTAVRLILVYVQIKRRNCRRQEPEGATVI